MNTINGNNALGTSRLQSSNAAGGVESSRGGNRSEGADALAGPQDQASFSAISREMGEIRAQIAATPDVRAEKVAVLKAQIANGTYTVDTTAVARRLLGNLG